MACACTTSFDRYEVGDLCAEQNAGDASDDAEHDEDAALTTDAADDAADGSSDDSYPERDFCDAGPDAKTKDDKDKDQPVRP